MTLIEGPAPEGEESERVICSDCKARLDIVDFEKTCRVYSPEHQKFVKAEI